MSGRPYLLEGVWAGEQEALEPDMSRLEQEGRSSSSLVYLFSSTTHMAGLSRSIPWEVSR